MYNIRLREENNDAHTEKEMLKFGKRTSLKRLNRSSLPSAQDVITRIEAGLGIAVDDKFYGNGLVPEYQRLLAEKGSTELIQLLESALLSRQTRRKNIRNRVKQGYLKKLKEENKRSLKLAEHNQQGTTNRGRFSNDLKEAQHSDINLISNNTAFLDNTDSEASDDDLEAAPLPDDLAREGPRLEPDEWIGLPDKAVVQPDQGAAYFQWIRRESEAEDRRSRDPTCTQSDKSKTRTRDALDSHLKTSFHDRESQLKRAVVAEAGTEINCSCCGDEMRKNMVLSHIMEEHGALLYFTAK
ncbi:hypothetical protein C7974DRAFT_375759 [Boeremia exigua]|uniref:uncharacterized protein n=1 Tax=Boeremia exigua TaxID=749465 RepID=UPI001E8ED4DB|nr:uncharacterized protein C7974DRAFT_375759 [Boeremia exigua]KAH6633717.1 hypothetical protein C7974DRAFT_375759 [Boeremia exigua]